MTFLCHIQKRQISDHLIMKIFTYVENLYMFITKKFIFWNVLIFSIFLFEQKHVSSGSKVNFWPIQATRKCKCFFLIWCIRENISCIKFLLANEGLFSLDIFCGFTKATTNNDFPRNNFENAYNEDVSAKFYS